MEFVQQTTHPASNVGHLPLHLQLAFHQGLVRALYRPHVPTVALEEQANQF